MIVRCENRDKFIELTTRHLLPLISLRAEMSNARVSAEQVDGDIIGTGESDFTKGNVEYSVSLDGKNFLLIDVPGIEGNESRYEDLIRRAVAKSHLVFYVNGTNKKPERETSVRIAKYLNRYAVVHAVCNFRGKADTYEFDEDRRDLTVTHRDSRQVEILTKQTLSGILGEARVLGVSSVQGLVAFCALSMNDAGWSTISPKRQHDLRRDQNSYLECFSSCDEMLEFSKIQELKNVISNKISTFDDDIKRINNNKILSLIDEKLELLDEGLGKYDSYVRECGAVVDGCSDSIQMKLDRFRSTFHKKVELAFDAFYQDIEDGACAVVSKYYKDKDVFNSEIQKITKVARARLDSEVSRICKAQAESLYDEVGKLLKNLASDLGKVKIAYQLNEVLFRNDVINDALKKRRFSLNAAIGVVDDIFSYGMSGAQIGTAILPMVGTTIGAVVGSVVGAIVVFLKSIFVSKDAKIREDQDKIRIAINNEKANQASEIESLASGVVREVEDSLNHIFENLGYEHQKMAEARYILFTSIEALKHVKYQLNVGEI